MTTIQTETLDLSRLSPSEVHQVYCGLDNCMTSECFIEEKKLLDQNEYAQHIYRFERELQAPYLEVMLRGFAVNLLSRQEALHNLQQRIIRLQHQLMLLTNSVSAMPFTEKLPRSQSQLATLFFDILKFPEIWTSKKGIRKLSMDRMALEKLYDTYLYARPFISHILAIRDLSKQREVLEKEVDPDGRFRSSYNIAGTETGRPSSSENAFGTGSNAQNIAPALRYIFVADPGYKLCVIDFSQSEARDLGFIYGCLFKDWSYLDSCESGDLHTNNAKLVWPELPWTGDPIEDRQIADRIFYRDFSYRDMSKRGGHLCLTSDHEVLTPSGWVPITERPFFIMAWSETGSDFEEVQHWTDEQYSDKLVHFEGNSISLCMTENHRVPYKTDQRNAGPIKTRRAIEGPGIHMPLGWGYKGGREDVPARLIAAFMSDGSQDSTNRMRFHLKKPRKIDRLKFLCDLYQFEYEEMQHDRISVHGNLPKRAGPFMLEWTLQSIKDFIDEYKYWDGHISKTAVSLFSIDREHLEWIQTLGRITGVGGNINTSIVQSNFSGSTKTYETTYYALQQNNRQWASGNSVSFQTEETDQPVRVLCPTVKSKFFYVRRNGKICVTGNSNYMGTAWTMARHLKITQAMSEDFQRRYCRGSDCAFPAISQYWRWVTEQIQTTYHLVTPLGRSRHFFGNTQEDTTIRKAVAFVPQSTTADRTNIGFWKVWKHHPKAQLLAQGYDSITFQALDDSSFVDTIKDVMELFRLPITDPASGRTFEVPSEAKCGYNWGYASNSNPTGLKSFSI